MYYAGHIRWGESVTSYRSKGVVSCLVISASVWVFILPLYALPSCSKFSASIPFPHPKITYLFHCPFSRKTLIKSKQIHFYMFLIGSEHEPVVVMYIFTETIRLFMCFLPVFSSFRFRVLYLSTFQFLSASLWKYTTALISN
jgi:hypothetical protein